MNDKEESKENAETDSIPEAAAIEATGDATPSAEAGRTKVGITDRGWFNRRPPNRR
jgi:hypothetical protein